MKQRMNRRVFVGSALASSVFAGTRTNAAGTPILTGLAPVTDEEARSTASTVQFRPEIEPLVRLIENTPRQRLMEEIGSQVKAGLNYQQLLGALFLAGIRNVQPRPAVGFKFHAILVVNSAHLASLASPAEDRWLPIFWALDEFKSSQARDVNEGDWTMAAVKESQLPAPDVTVHAFRQAMKKWDEAAADVAAASVTRHLGAGQVLELYAEFAARDFRSIGHKAIYLANGWRTLQTIGWQHAEPVMRSLAYAMLNHNGEPNPSDADLPADRSWRYIETVADDIREGWTQSVASDNVKTDARVILSTIRTGSATDAVDAVVDLLNAGSPLQSIWDQIHLAAGELMMRQSGIVALHAVTTTNAMRFLFDHVGTDRTRRMLLLQAAAFLPQFRDAMVSRGKLRDDRIDTQFETFEIAGTGSTNQEALQRVLSNIRRDSGATFDGTLEWLAAGNNPQDFINATRRLVFLKGNDAHDYKFSSAAMEDFYNVSPTKRPFYLAACANTFRGSQEPDNKLITRIQAALS
ncbi:MAG: hypothetical protein KDA91_10840 [Planctomycetaceae bacterium]|nr:hypothetical protein [Planctomycetaceae bacterium]